VRALGKAVDGSGERSFFARFVLPLFLSSSMVLYLYLGFFCFGSSPFFHCCSSAYNCRNQVTVYLSQISELRHSEINGHNEFHAKRFFCGFADIHANRNQTVCFRHQKPFLEIVKSFPNLKIE